MSVEVTSDELEEKSSERQPWEPPTEEETSRAVEMALGSHLDPATEENEEEPASKDAIPADGEKKQEKAGEESEAKAEGESEEQKEEGQEVELPTPLPSQSEEKPGRLERRIAKLYVKNLALSEQDAPDIEVVLKELVSGKYTHEQKMQMLHIHRRENKELRGIDVRRRDPEEDEDVEILKEAERSQIRQEIRQEEHQKIVEKSFVSFLKTHPELDEEAKEYNPMLSRAVETLWKSGMLIHDAYETVTSQFKEVKEEQEKLQQKGKQKALSGVMSASSKATAAKDENEYTWTEFNQLMIDDPATWQDLVQKGYKPKN